ncbi:MAG: hypothetical protein ACOC87_04160 [Candidatus Natronoplasma sp.]
MKEIIEDLEISSNYVIKAMDYSILKSISTDERDFSIHDKIISRDEKIQGKTRVEVIW